jgi:hypothetical protein
VSGLFPRRTKIGLRRWRCTVQQYLVEKSCLEASGGEMSSIRSACVQTSEVIYILFRTILNFFKFFFYPRLRLSVKLCALMGITWLFEIASWALDVPEYYWYMTDAINSLRGFFIFLICCCKKKVFLLLWNTLCRRGSQSKIEINDYYLRTAASNPALARRLTITSETDSSYQLTTMSLPGLRRLSLPR